MDTVHHQPMKGLGILHFHRAPKREAPGILPILPEHIVAGAIRLVLHVAEHLVQHRQLIVLIDQQVFIGETDVLLSLKHRVLGIGVDDVRAVDQLLVPGAARRIIAGYGRFGHVFRESFSDDIAVKIRVQPHDSRIAPLLHLRPLP